MSGSFDAIDRLVSRTIDHLGPRLNAEVRPRDTPERSHEAMLLVTTSMAHAAPAAAYIRENHSSAAPQILTLQIAE